MDLYLSIPLYLSIYINKKVCLFFMHLDPVGTNAVKHCIPSGEGRGVLFYPKCWPPEYLLIPLLEDCNKSVRVTVFWITRERKEIETRGFCHSTPEILRGYNCAQIKLVYLLTNQILAYFNYRKPLEHRFPICQSCNIEFSRTTPGTSARISIRWSYILGVTCNLISWYVPTVLYWSERLLNAINPPKHADTGIIFKIGNLI
jgi:hypothetical protein